MADVAITKTNQPGSEPTPEQQSGRRMARNSASLSR